MRNNTLSINRTRALHVTVILILLAALLLIVSASTYAASDTAGSAQINCKSGVYLRKSTTTKSKKVALLPDNTELTIYKEVFKSKTSIAKKNVWYYVKANGKTGYVRSDLVDNVRYSTVAGTVKSKTNYRRGPGTKMKKKGTLKKNASVTIYLDANPVSKTKGSSKTWYKIKQGSSYYYVCSSNIRITGNVQPAVQPAPASTAQPSQAQVSQVVNLTANAFSTMSNAQFESYMKNQGFPESYKTGLRALHAQHPNWVFVGYRTGIDWMEAMKKETKYAVSLVSKSYPASYRSTSKNSISSYTMNASTLSASRGSTYYQVEPGWYNADAYVVAYYMDPRNFLNEDRIYMFEDLAYKSEYQTATVVTKIIGNTKLSSYGFTTNLFMSAGAAYKVSPVFLAARVVQETGGNSASVNGSKSGGKVVYNPFNIGATGSNPVAAGLAYAKKQGWTTPTKALNGGASYLASGYINKKQNSIYFQRFNVANGLSKVGTHQYMTNTMAPYSEAYITKQSYTKLGIHNEPLGFIIPIYENMPDKTILPPK